MYYVLSFERDEWGKMYWFKRGTNYKSFQTACRNAAKYTIAFVYRYNNTDKPVYTHGVMV